MSATLTRSHQDRTADGPDYRNRLAAFEQRLSAKLVTRPSSHLWAVGKRAPYTYRYPEWSDHPAYFEGEGIRYFVTQPYRAPSDATLLQWAEQEGFDGYFRLPDELGFWNVPACAVLVFWRRK